MIIGGSKKEVIENIKKNLKNSELNKKVETEDPIFSEEESKEVLARFYNLRKHKISFFFKSTFVNYYANIVNSKINKDIEIIGSEKLKNINSGAIITSNHFNPLDSLIPRTLVKKIFKKNIYIVSQETNLKLPGFLGFIVNHLNVIPLRYSPNYIIKEFTPKLTKILKKKNYVLIYPEEEMWFNYRKPRPCKRGAYEFAYKINVPIISLFTEIIDLDSDDNEEFKNVKYKVHILDIIYPDKSLSSKNAIKKMAETDYKQKCEAYEKAYNKKLDYTFSYDDIAGYKPKKTC